MKKLKYILILVLITASSNLFSQNLDRTYQGWWATTSWTFEFKKDGNYLRISSGHFGNTTVSGKYHVINDTIKLLSGFDKTSGTINEYYLLEGDSILIDLNLRYDYKIVSSDGQNFYNSQIREIKYPQIKTDDKKLKSELEEVLNLAFNSKEIRVFYHFDKIPDRNLIIASYHSLDAKIKVDSQIALFKPKTEIDTEFFVEFDDINQNQDRIQLEIKINGEGVRIWFTFYKDKGKWVYREPSIFEN